MKSEWKECTLGDITDLVIDHRGKTPKKLGGDWSKDSTHYRALSAKNIKTGQIVNPESIRFVEPKMYRRWMKDEVQRGDVFITSEAPFGQVLYWNSDEKIVLSQRLFGLRLSKRVCSQFVYYYMTSPAFQSELDARATGTTVFGLRQPELMKCKVNMPSCMEQRKIAAILSSLDDKIENNNAICRNLEEQADAVFQRSLGAKFNQVPFFSLIEVQGGGTPKTSQSEYWNGEIPFFTPKDVRNPFVFETIKSLTQAGLSHCNSPLYPSWTTFVTARGTVGKLAIAGCSMAMNQSCYALVGKDVHPLLVYFYARSVVDSLRKKSTGSVFDAIVTRDFETESINRIPNEKLFVDLAMPMYEAIHKLLRENMDLAVLRDTLLPKLMSGEIDVDKVSI